jgi:hypothetical protein
MRRLLLPLLAAAVLLTAAAPAGAAIVVKGRYTSFSTSPLAISYTSSKGDYKATLIRRGHYRLSGRITGKRLRGSFHTRQVAGDRYVASGSGRLGGRKVRIGGGGPNDLKTSRLVLR